MITLERGETRNSARRVFGAFILNLKNTQSLLLQIDSGATVVGGSDA